MNTVTDLPLPSPVAVARVSGTLAPSGPSTTTRVTRPSSKRSRDINGTFELFSKDHVALFIYFLSAVPDQKGKKQRSTGQLRGQTSTSGNLEEGPIA
jgi:hypothetical protein